MGQDDLDTADQQRENLELGGEPVRDANEARVARVLAVVPSTLVIVTNLRAAARVRSVCSLRAD